MDVGDGGHHTVRDVVLHREDVGSLQVAVVGFRPEVRAGLGVDQLNVDANRGGAFANPAFQHVAGAQLLSHGAHIRGLPFETNRRISRDDGKKRKARQARVDVFRKTFRKRFQLGVGAGVRERQDGNPQRLRPVASRILLKNAPAIGVRARGTRFP